jgi:lipoprotein-anchoring transpeptidase ErfK/SrfK
MQVRIIHPPHRLSSVHFSEGDHYPLIGDIQKRLSELGLYRLEAHGLFDADTAEALSRFQETAGLRVTGELDLPTYCRLQHSNIFEITPAIRPRANPALARPNILIAKSVRQLTLFNGNTPLRQYPVAIGKPATPTPEGNFAIALKVMNPGGVLGSRWMGLNYDAYGIHGTNAPWKIGQMVSNGCIRMHNANAEELFAFIHVGTPVFIRN